MKVYAKSINIQVPDELHADFKKIAKENGQTVKGLLILLMRKEIQRNAKEK